MDENGISIIYEGEFHHYKEHGKGKLFKKVSENTIETFEGEWDKGKMVGEHRKKRIVKDEKKVYHSTIT